MLAIAQTAGAEVRRNLGALREVRDNMAEGLRFYMSLQEAIAVLAQQAGDYALTRRLQRCAPTLFPHPVHLQQPQCARSRSMTCFAVACKAGAEGMNKGWLLP